jgi:glyoxylate/hydroxypyruvate reductase
VVVILFHLPDASSTEWLGAIERALPAARVRVWPDAGDTPADYALVFAPPKEMLPELSRAKAIFNLGAGVNAFAQLPSLPPSIPVIRLEDAGMAMQMVEYATYAVLRWFREFRAYQMQQSECRWEQRRRLDKQAFGVGVLGLGTLGTPVATVLRNLGFPVSGFSRTPRDVPGVRTFAGEAARDAFLAGSRVLLCMLPLTPATEGVLNRDTLKRLPRGAYLVNVGRGALLIERDLLELLDDGHIAGALLDVFRSEPLPADHPFWHHPRIELTPHVSAVTQVGESVSQIAAKIARLEAGLPVTGSVDRALGY